MKTLIFVVYIAVGIVVAAMNDYLAGVGSINEIINLVLAIVLWPAVLLGVDFNVNLVDDKGDKGEGGKEDSGRKGDKKNGALLLVGGAATYARALAGALSTRRRARSAP